MGQSYESPHPPSRRILSGAKRRVVVSCVVSVVSAGQEATTRRLESVKTDGWTADVEAAGFSHRQTISVSILTGSHLVAGTPIAERLGIPDSERVVVRSRVRYIGPGPDQGPRRHAGASPGVCHATSEPRSRQPLSVGVAPK